MTQLTASVKRMTLKRQNSFFGNKRLIVLHQNIAGLINKADVLTVCLEELAESTEP